MRRWTVIVRTSVAAILLASCFTGGNPRIVASTRDGIRILQRADQDPGKLVVINAVEYRGRFIRSGKCLVLISDGARYTPVFHNQTDIQRATEESEESGKSHLWSIAGGPANDRIEVAAQTLGSCRLPLFMIVSLSDPR